MSAPRKPTQVGTTSGQIEMVGGRLWIWDGKDWKQMPIVEPPTPSRPPKPLFRPDNLVRRLRDQGHSHRG